MRQSFVIFILLFAVITTVFPVYNVKVTAQTDAKPFISEINFRGSLSATRCIMADKLANYKASTNWCGKDQWLEITNPSSQSLDLANWSLEFRNKKTANLLGLTIPANESIVITFTQSNFQSIIKNSNLSSYQVLYISSESGKDVDKHNITAILKSGAEIVDSLNTHPKNIDADYLNGRGKSYFRCKSDDIWKMTTTKYGQEENYATPQKFDPSCDKAATMNNNLVTPPVNKVKINQPQVKNSPSNQKIVEIKPVKQLQKVAVPKQVVAIVPQFELQNISAINLNAVSQKSFESSYSKNFGTNSDLNFNSLNLPNSNLQNAYRYEFESLFSYYYQENLSILNVLLLTGLVFRLIKNVDTKLFNLFYYASRIKKRWQPNF